MNVLENREMFPVPGQYANGIGEHTEFEPADKTMHWNRVLAVYGAAAMIGLTGLQNGPLAERATAFQRGDVSEQLNGKLGRVVGTQLVTLKTQYSTPVEMNKAMIDNYDRTCRRAIDPWENLRRIVADPYTGNQAYKTINERYQPGSIKRVKYLKNRGGAITIRAPRCDGDPNEASSSQLPAWEPVVTIGVSDFGKEALEIRKRTRCSAFPYAWWEYEEKKLNPGYFEDFIGLSIDLSWPDVAPASIGIRLRFPRAPLRFMVCSKQNRNNFTALPTLPSYRFGVRDIRAETP